MDEATSRELRFEPSGSLIGLLIFLPTYGLGGGLATWMTYRQLMTSASSQALGLAQATLLIVLYLLGAYLLLLYFVLGPRRFRFYDSFFTVFTWRGRMRFPWSAVCRAALSTYRGNVELALFIGRVRRVSVPLTGFRKAASLLTAIRVRITVPLEASEAQLALVRDLADSGAHGGA